MGRLGCTQPNSVVRAEISSQPFRNPHQSSGNNSTRWARELRYLQDCATRSPTSLPQVSMIAFQLVTCQESSLAGPSARPPVILHRDIRLSGQNMCTHTHTHTPTHRRQTKGSSSANGVLNSISIRSARGGRAWNCRH